VKEVQCGVQARCCWADQAAGRQLRSSGSVAGSDAWNAAGAAYAPSKPTTIGQNVSSTFMASRIRWIWGRGWRRLFDLFGDWGRCFFASTQGQALAALLSPYKQLQEIELSWLDDVVRAKRSQCVPTVFAASEVARALPMPVSTASWRHTIAAHWLASGQDIRTAQAFLWHSDVNTILVYAHAV